MPRPPEAPASASRPEVGPLEIADLRVYRADIPLRRAHVMSFTTLEAVNYVFVRLETRQGLVGWGEAACLGGPTWSEESAESVAATVTQYLAPALRGRDASRIEPLRQEMARRVRGNPFARAAVEMALWDLNGRALGVPVHRLLGGRVRDRVALSWSLAGSDVEAEVAEARELGARGHRIFKLKVGARSLDEDLGRLRRVREALGPGVSLRVDANQGWDRLTALRALRALEPFEVEFVEQPLPRWDLRGLSALGRRSAIPIMADESCASPQDALELARLGGVGILGLKVTKSGGLTAALTIARIAEAAGLGAYVGCMIETSLGTAAYLHLALAAPAVTWGCELFGPLLLQGDVVRTPVRYAEGAILGLDGPGLGVEVDDARLAAWAPAGPRGVGTTKSR